MRRALVLLIVAIAVPLSAAPAYLRRTAPNGRVTVFLARTSSACAPDPKTEPGQFIYFNSKSRFSSDQAALPLASIIQWKWELVDANDAVVVSGPVGTVTGTTSPAWNVPSWGVAKCSVTPGARARLTLTQVQ